MPPEDEKQDDQQTEGTGDQGAQSGTDTGEQVDWKAEAEKWKGLSRKHEGQAKANADAAKRLKDLEDADKTEAQRASEARAESEKLREKAEGELMRLRVAMRKGLTEAQAKRLVGSTEEELEADADELLSSFGQQKKSADEAGPTRPKERLRSGAAPDEEPDETDPRKLAASVPRL